MKEEKEWLLHRIQELLPKLSRQKLRRIYDFIKYIYIHG